MTFERKVGDCVEIVQTFSQSKADLKKIFIAIYLLKLFIAEWIKLHEVFVSNGMTDQNAKFYFESFDFRVLTSVYEYLN